MIRVLSSSFAAALKRLSRHPARLILALTLAAALVNTGALVLRGSRPRLVRGDAVHYYVYARSLVFDRDLDFENDYKALYSLDFSVTPPPQGFTWQLGRTSTGRVRNYMAVGTPLIWMPLYLGVTAGVAAYDAAGGHYPLDGYGRLFQLVPGFSGLAAGALGVWFTFLLCRDLRSPQAALFATLSAFAGTSFIYYLVVAPAYSHAISACVSAAFFLSWWRKRDDTRVSRYAALGALVGLMALVRWQDGLALGVLAIDAAVHGWRLPGRGARVRFALTRFATAAAAALVVFVPQLVVWQILYGQPFTIPQGAGFMRWTTPAIGSVLFSPFRGLVSWTPLAAAGMLGLPLMWRHSKRLAVAAGWFWLTSIYVNAAVADWWAGEAFGARRFLSCFPLMAIGLTLVVAGRNQRQLVARAGAVGLVLANLLLLFHYEIFMLGYRSLAAYPGTWRVLWVERFVTPFVVLRSLF